MLWRDKSENPNEGDLFVHVRVDVRIILNCMYTMYNINSVISIRRCGL